MWSEFRADLGRLKRYDPRSRVWRELLFNQGIWALFAYRLGRHLYLHRLPPVLHQLAMLLYLPWKKFIDTFTGISLPVEADIGPGLYIGHYGGIFVNPGVVIGRDCNISQGVTLGSAGRGDRRGAPVLGDRVFVAAGAKVIGPVELADGTVVGANAVVTRSTEENAVVGGIPARVISHDGSADFID